MPQKGFDLPLLVPQMHNTDFYGTFGCAVEHKGESLGPCHPIVQTSLQGFQESRQAGTTLATLPIWHQSKMLARRC